MLLRDDMDDMRSWKYQTSDQLKVTLLGTNISLSKAILKVSFLFPRWDMLIPWRVVELFQMVYPFLKYWNTGLKTSCFAKIIVISSPQKNWADFQRFFTLGDPEKQPTDLRSLDIAWGGWKKMTHQHYSPQISGEFTMVMNLPWYTNRYTIRNKNHQLKKQKSPRSRYTSDTTGFFRGFVTFFSEKLSVIFFFRDATETARLRIVLSIHWTCTWHDSRSVLEGFWRDEASRTEINIGLHHKNLVAWENQP